MWSKAGTWFRDAEGGRVEEPQSSALVSSLDLSSKGQCDAVRREVRLRVNAERTYVSIKDWRLTNVPVSNWRSVEPTP